MKILFISNGSGLSDVKSGGVTRLIELMRQFSDQGCNVKIMTTIGGYKLFQREEVRGTFKIVKSSIIWKTETSNIQRAISYLIATVYALFALSKKQNNDAVYSSSDYFCDVIPAVYHKILYPKTKYFAMVHHLAKRSSITKRRSIFDIVSEICQLISFQLIARFADTVFLYENIEGISIGKRLINIKPVKLDYVKNGVDFKLISQSRATSERYEACFVGGLRASKGIFDLIEIWEKVVELLPSARVIVIGAGTKETLDHVHLHINKCQLSNNIILIGEKNGVELFGLIKSSKMLIAPSHEEGWGIAICEALASDIPVVAYELDVYTYLGNSIVRVPMSNTHFFAKAVVSNLNKNNLDFQLSYFKSHIKPEISWEYITRKEYLKIFSIVNPDNLYTTPV